jgi:hypothetical protein
MRPYIPVAGSTGAGLSVGLNRHRSVRNHVMSLILDWRVKGRDSGASWPARHHRSLIRYIALLDFTPAFAGVLVGRQFWIEIRFKR